MRNATTLLLVLGLCFAGPALAQETDFVWDAPLGTDPTAPYSEEQIGGQFSGSHSVSGPYDLDDDGRIEVLVSDWTGGGRIHVVEITDSGAWELVYSTPYQEDGVGPRSFIVAARDAIGGDLDGDGRGEIIFVSGDEWTDVDANPTGTAAIFVYEHTGTDNDYGTEPVAIFAPENFGTAAGDAVASYAKTDNIALEDIDGDGTEELLWTNDTGIDEWFVFSVSGNMDGSGFAVLVPELRLSSGNDGDEAFDPVLRGGGSTYAMTPADLDGDGSWEISLHSWNAFNFTNVDVAGADTYVAPGDGDPNVYLQASGNDDLSWYGGVAVDINGDGDDEVFYPREYGFEDDANGNLYEYVSVLNYEDGEDVLQITTDQFALDAIGPLTAYGIDAGDLNGDGQPELIGAGRGFGGAAHTAGEMPAYLRVAEWIGDMGADPEDPANYRVTELTFPVTPMDTLFNLVYRVDADNVETFYYENAGELGAFPVGEGEEISPTSINYLGDPDGDGNVEIAAGFYGINDTLRVIDEVWDTGTESYVRTTRELIPAPARPVFRIFEVSPDFSVATEDAVVLPSDYVLSANYPNPFNPTTTFDYTLPLDKTVSVRVYDVQGRLVKTLVRDAHQAAGTYTVTWDGTSDAGASVASGTYFYTLEYGNFRQARQMTLIK